MTVVSSLRAVLRTVGIDSRRFPSQMEDFDQLKYFFSDVETVIDVGAAQGQFGKKCRGYGYEGRLVSFEPILNSYTTLSAVSSRDKNWTAWRLALSSGDGEQIMHVASNSGHSSSLRKMLPTHALAAPEVTVVRTEKVTATSLDSFVKREYDENVLGRIALKIDAQGEELEILKGAKNTLPGCKSVLLEMSLTPLYEAASNWREMISYMESAGYSMVGVIPGFTSKSGEMLQFDGVFRRVGDQLPLAAG